MDRANPSTTYIPLGSDGDPSIVEDDGRGCMSVHGGGQYMYVKTLARCILLGIDHLAEGADKSKEGELHEVIVEQFLHQLKYPIQSTLGHDLTDTSIE